MSVVENSVTSGSPPPESWVGKSRNAKAQARHRAKRKAYIEQLEQTVSKLQTALALSRDEVKDLPTAQMKLRELKEENDTLRAELRKLQVQPSCTPAPPPSSSYRNELVTPMLSPASSEERLRHTKKRKMSQENVHVTQNMQAYLGLGDVTTEPSRFHHPDSRQALQVSVAPQMPSPPGVIHLQTQMTLTQPSPSDAPLVQQPRNGMFSWQPFSPYSEESLMDCSPMSWTFPQSSHYRHRSSSASSVSSTSESPHLAQALVNTNTPMQASLAVSHRRSSMDGDGARHDAIPKTEEAYTFPHASDATASYDLAPHTIPLTNPAVQDTWPDGPWSYSAVRTR